MEVDKKLVAKWGAVVDNLSIRIKNKFIREHLCNYLDWSAKNSNNDADKLKKTMNEILVAIEDSSRLEIIGKFFNTTTGIIEYKLSDGTFVPIEGEINRALSNNEMIKIFGIDYLKYYDLETYRDLKINNIIDGRTN